MRCCRREQQPLVASYLPYDVYVDHHKNRQLQPVSSTSSEDNITRPVAPTFFGVGEAVQTRHFSKKHWPDTAATTQQQHPPVTSKSIPCKYTRFTWCSGVKRSRLIGPERESGVRLICCVRWVRRAPLLFKRRHILLLIGWNFYGPAFFGKILKFLYCSCVAVSTGPALSLSPSRYSTLKTRRRKKI